MYVMDFLIYRLKLYGRSNLDDLSADLNIPTKDKQKLTRQNKLLDKVRAQNSEIKATNYLNKDQEVV